MEDRKITIDRLSLDGSYRSLVEDGSKKSTIRYGYVLIQDVILPLFYGKAEQAGMVQVEKVDYTRTFASLTHDDASTNGFESLEQLKTALTKIYPTITDQSRCTIIYFSPVRQ